MIEVEQATRDRRGAGTAAQGSAKRRRKNGRSCEDCFFHRNLLCALDLDAPCSTFRPDAPGGLVPPRQPALLVRESRAGLEPPRNASAGVADARIGAMAQERTARLERLTAAVREPLPRLLLAGPPRGPGADLRPGDRRRWSCSARATARARSRSSACSLAGLAALDADGVLASPQGLPLGARPPDRPPAALHHPRRPPRPSQRPAAAGDAAGREHPAGRAVLRRSSGSIFGLPTACRCSPASWSATWPTTTPTITCTISCPEAELGKRLREQHMRHHFQDHRYGFGVSSPLWDAVFRTLPRTRRD